MFSVPSLACVSLQTCSTQHISDLNHDDLTLSVKDDKTLLLSCTKTDHLLNLPALKYPESVEAVCTNNYIGGELPFWSFKVDEFFPRKSNLCLSKSRCQTIPFLSEDFVSTWTGSTELGTTFQFFCDMDDSRG